ncbi:MAG: hypothetical protein GWO24_15365 [Akkermansiaceae bacterium]|nr:hypothetical protein [Akkermansiaceae bacterium]
MLFGSGCVSQPYPRYGGPNLNTYLALAEVVGRSAAAYGAYRAMEESLEEFEDLASRRAPGFGWTPAGRDCRP